MQHAEHVPDGAVPVLVLARDEHRHVGQGRALQHGAAVAAGLDRVEVRRVPDDRVPHERGGTRADRLEGEGVERVRGERVARHVPERGHHRPDRLERGRRDVRREAGGVHREPRERADARGVRVEQKVRERALARLGRPEQRDLHGVIGMALDEGRLVDQRVGEAQRVERVDEGGLGVARRDGAPVALEQRRDPAGVGGERTGGRTGGRVGGRVGDRAAGRIGRHPLTAKSAASPANTARPKRLLSRKAAKQAAGSRSRTLRSWRTASTSATRSPAA